MPMVFAASTTSVPAGTMILWPSMVRLTSGTYSSLSNVALVPERVVLVLAAEVAERGVDHPAARVAQAAQAAPVLQAVGNALEDLEVDSRALVAEDALIRPDRPVLADAARGALAARFVRVEPHEPVRGLDDAVRVVHHDHPAGAAHRLRRRQRLCVGRHVQHRFREDGRR